MKTITSVNLADKVEIALTSIGFLAVVMVLNYMSTLA